MAGRQSFYQMFGKYLVNSVYAGPGQDGAWRFGVPQPGPDGARTFAVPERAANDANNMGKFAAFFPRFAKAFDAFEDLDSGMLMIIIIAYRILGPERVQLNITWPQYRAWMAELAPLLEKEKTHDAGFGDMVLDLYNLHSAGIPIRVQTTRSSLLAHYFLKQYEFSRKDAFVKIDPGDTIIEGGMCFGDTALFFAHLAGENGRVIGYEFEPNNLAIMRENFDFNPDLAKRIQVTRHALSARSGEKLEFVMAGPATQPYRPDMGDAPKVRVSTLTIDDLAAREKLDRVDFIKLDVEGAEMGTLRGAVETLKKFRPKLALSAYHLIDDVPNFIDFLQSLDLGYRFWLDHYRAYDQETVLFAKV